MKKLVKGNKIPTFATMRNWRTFKSIFVEYHETIREEFFRLVFQPHMSQDKVTSTFAESIFGLKGSKLQLALILDGLLNDGLLPQPTPKTATVSTPEVPTSEPTPVSTTPVLPTKLP
jgi:hypothetical protein